MRLTIAMFGEAEIGPFVKPVFLTSLSQLNETFGHPPEESQGLFFAIQTLLYQRNLLFLRVEDEGFSSKDYMEGLKLLKANKTLNIGAIGLPGIGDPEILDFGKKICDVHKSVLVITEKDFYDYLTF